MGLLAVLSSHVKKVLARRSPRWRSLELATLRANPTCGACPNKSHLQVHHIFPFHLHPELELDPDNLVVLCEAPGQDCHLLIGHSGTFAGFNPDVRAHAALVKQDPTRRAEVVAAARAGRKYA